MLINGSMYHKDKTVTSICTPNNRAKMTELKEKWIVLQ